MPISALISPFSRSRHADQRWSGRPFSRRANAPAESQAYVGNAAEASEGTVAGKFLGNALSIMPSFFSVENGFVQRLCRYVSLGSAQRQVDLHMVAILFNQVLDKARKRLSDVTQERSRVLDLICHAIPATSASARPASRRTRCTVPSTNGWPSSINCFSPMLDIDPLGAYTPEVDSALRDAAVARQRQELSSQRGHSLNWRLVHT